MTSFERLESWLSTEITVITEATGTAICLASAVIDSQGASVDDLTGEELLSLDGALSIDEVSVCKTSWLAGVSVNGNSDIKHVANLAEELVQVGIGHLEGKVADEEGLGWLIERAVLEAGLGNVVDSKRAALKDTQVLSRNGVSSLLSGLELNICKAVARILALIDETENKCVLTPCYDHVHPWKF